ncbi:MAG: hypothetical protein ACKPEA_19300, partial [Planctomycetota bacterium]
MSEAGGAIASLAGLASIRAGRACGALLAIVVAMSGCSKPASDEPALSAVQIGALNHGIGLMG